MRWPDAAESKGHREARLLGAKLAQVGREQAGLGTQPAGGVLLAERFVAVGIGGVAGDLVAQDGLLLAVAEVTAGGLRGAEPRAGAGDVAARRGRALVRRRPAPA